MPSRSPLGRRAPAPLRPWREGAVPHPDVSGGRYLEAEFAADLAQVVAGRASREYGDPAEFFRRTHLTEGLRRLLAEGMRRLAGLGGEPVVQLKTAFGGGKTHAMLALYHLFGGQTGADRPAGLAGVLRDAGTATPPAARLAVLVAPELNAAQPWPCRALGGDLVRTLWGELAAQLGGPQAYAHVRREDEQGIPPGTAGLVELLQTHGPALVLVDELVAFMRVLYGGRDLPAGSFDANLTFLQSLTEAVKRSRTSMLVLTVPDSDVERGGEGGREAAARIEAVLGRLESIWRPVAAGEVVEVVRRRLFLPDIDEAVREATCRAFGRMYAAQAADFPPEAREPAYLDRLRAGYPIHPEVFDRLYEDWSTLERFQRTRGVLRLLAAAVHHLWTRRDASPLILPGSLPLDAPQVRERLTGYLDEGWNGVLATDVDGPQAQPLAVERENPRLAQAAAARRLARAIFLGSAPAARRPVRGMEDTRVRLGVVQPGEPVALFNDAVARLRERLTHLHGDEHRLWYDLRPNLNRTASERAAAVEAWRVDAEVRRRLATRERADFTAAPAVYRPGLEIADEPAARLVVLPLGEAHPAANGGADTPAASPAVELAARVLDGHRGTGDRNYRNMLLFVAADHRTVAGVEQGTRQYLAWRSIADEADPLSLDALQRRQAGDALALSDAALDRRLQEAYSWLLVPTQDGTNPVHFEAIRIPGSDPYVARAARRLHGGDLLITRWAAALLRMELDRWLWRDAEHVRLHDAWEALARYCYLPRLRDEAVLLAAVAEGVAAGDHFGYADGVAPDGSYRGLRFGEPAAVVRVDAAAVLVKAETAARQRQREAAVHAALGGTTTHAAGGIAEREGRREGACGDDIRGSGLRPAARFHGAVDLDPLQVERGAGRVVAEVLRYLTGLPGAEVEVRLAISARVPGGVPEDVARVLSENCRVLRFRAATFEEG